MVIPFGLQGHAATQGSAGMDDVLRFAGQGQSKGVSEFLMLKKR